MLERNLAAMSRSTRVRVVQGVAPAVLADLPKPDAVFLGGTGGQLRAILAASADVLAPGGRIVANLVTLDRVSAMLAWAHDHGYDAELVQVSIARGAEIAGQTRLEAQNPVFIVTVTR